MSPAATRTRFAPSPTGELHVGNVRTALFSKLLAARDDGVFVLRIEDTDAARDDPGHFSGLMEDLHWLGLGWGEGPDVGGPNAPYRQSERRSVYSRYFEQLEAENRAYPCYCTPAELATARKTLIAAGLPPRYTGTCANLTAEERSRRAARGLRPTLRFRVPAGADVEWDDLVRGPQRFSSTDIGDFIIRRADSTPAFFFSNAVDDALMRITHVLRGEDHLTNTPRQLLLLKALALPAPRYGHLALVVGADGNPLSKRHGSTSVRDLRRQGNLPEAVMNYLARLGHSYPDSNLLSFSELAAGFRLEHLGKAPAQFDIHQLLHWQKLAVAAATDEHLLEWLQQACVDEPDAERLSAVLHSGRGGQFVHAVRGNITIPADAAQLANHLFAVTPCYSKEGGSAVRAAGSDFHSAALDCVGNERRPYSEFIAALREKTGQRGRELYMPLRAALTGEIHGPELERIWALLTVTEIRDRLGAAVAECEKA